MLDITSLLITVLRSQDCTHAPDGLGKDKIPRRRKTLVHPEAGVLRLASCVLCPSSWTHLGFWVLNFAED